MRHKKAVARLAAALTLLAMAKSEVAYQETKRDRRKPSRWARIKSAVRIFPSRK